MNDTVDVRHILDWYITAGVEEICGVEPWEKNEKQKSVLPKKADIPVVKEDIRPAMTQLAQANVVACQNARQICEKVETLSELKKIVEEFDGCALRLTANKTVFGYGNENADVLLIGEAPGADEDRSGVPFVGRSGHLLDKMLQTINIDRNDCFVTNVLPWRPPGNRTPTEGETAVCLPFLRKQIDLVKPKVIIILGGSAANALLDNGEPISKLRGKWLEYKIFDGTKIPVIATFHPAYLLRNTAQKAKAWSDLLRVKQKLCEN